jgi:hypothetical protein
MNCIFVESILSRIKDPANQEFYIEFMGVLLNQGYKKAVVAQTYKLAFSTLAYPELEHLAFQLTLQVQALEARGFTLLFWQPSDILVVEIETARDADRPDKLYILTNLTQRVPLDPKDSTQLVLVYPKVFPLPKAYCAPELLQMKVLPFITPRSASYYSLGLLGLGLLKGLRLSLAEIKGTRLFYFLERCLKAEPQERVLLYL